MGFLTKLERPLIVRAIGAEQLGYGFKSRTR